MKLEEINQIKNNKALILQNNNYFQISARLFGESLAKLASKLFNENFKYQENEYILNIPWNYGSTFCKTTKLYTRFISTKKYEEYFRNITASKPFKKQDIFDTPFNQYPIIPDNMEYVFECSERELDYTILLGYIDKNKKFVPNNFNCNVFTRTYVKYNSNIDYSFIQTFALLILNYKLTNKKEFLTAEDMENIINEFPIEKVSQLVKTK